MILHAIKTYKSQTCSLSSSDFRWSVFASSYLKSETDGVGSGSGSGSSLVSGLEEFLGPNVFVEIQLPLSRHTFRDDFFQETPLVHHFHQEISNE